MNELHQILEALKQPEYVHVLLNPLPVYATAMGALALIVALLARSTPAKVVALVIVLVGTLSVWPVSEYGDRAADRVKAMSNPAGQAWLHAHEERVDETVWIFYVTAGCALAAMIALWKFPKIGQWLTLLTLVGAVMSLMAGAWISHAGGQIRHTEFRNGPPPAVPGEPH